MPCLYKCICAQEERIAPLYSSASQYTMSEQEENIVRLLRNALQEGSVQDAGGTYMRQIRDLDPPTHGVRQPGGLFACQHLLRHLLQGVLLLCAPSCLI